MTDLFQRLVTRGVGDVDVVAPRLPGRFEDGAAGGADAVDEPSSDDAPAEIAHRREERGSPRNARHEGTDARAPENRPRPVVPPPGSPPAPGARATEPPPPTIVELRLGTPSLPSEPTVDEAHRTSDSPTAPAERLRPVVEVDPPHADTDRRPADGADPAFSAPTLPPEPTPGDAPGTSRSTVLPGLVPASPPAAAESIEARSEAPIEIRIGRVEVRAAPAATPPRARRSVPAAPRERLAGYLARRRR